MITWSITDMVRTSDGGVVRTINYRVDIVDGVYSSYSYGTVTVPYKDPADPSFVPFDSLTEAETIEWVKGQVDVALIEVNLQKNIDAKKNPKEIKGLPW
jgi:hypothetical protein